MYKSVFSAVDYIDGLIFYSCKSYKLARHKLVYEEVAEPVLEASLAFQMTLINFGVYLCLVSL